MHDSKNPLTIEKVKIISSDATKTINFQTISNLNSSVPIIMILNAL